MPLSIKQLDRSVRVEHFDCGDKALNDYLRRFALKNQERLGVGVTYVAFESVAPTVAVGYHTLASSSIPKTSFPEDVRSRVSPYADVPVILLARLAVDRRFQQRGVGQFLLRHALQTCLQVREQIGCRCMIVDAYASALGWYQQFGFISIGDPAPKGRTQKMFIDLRTVQMALRTSE